MLVIWATLGTFLSLLNAQVGGVLWIDVSDDFSGRYLPGPTRAGVLCESSIWFFRLGPKLNFGAARQRSTYFSVSYTGPGP
jgi:hypothetical protein